MALTTISYGGKAIVYNSGYMQYTPGAASSTLLTNLRLYFKLDETSGDFADSADYGATTYAATTTAPRTTAGILNGCIDCSAGTEYCEIGDAVGGIDNVAPTADVMSYSVWVYLHTLPSTWANDAYAVMNNSNTGYIKLTNTGRIQLDFVDASLNSYYTNYLWSPSINTWYNIVSINNGSGLHAQCYVNNSEQSIYSETGVFMGVLRHRAADAYVGGYYDGVSSVNARCDEFGMWGKALTSTEVNTLWNGGAGKSYPFT